MTSPEVLIAEIQQYLQALGVNNVPPPIITSDMVITGTSPLEQALSVLILAANATDPHDNATTTTQQEQRSAGLSGAAAGFAANEEQSGAELGQVAGQGGQQVAQQAAGQGADQASQMAQQIPQIISGVAGGIAGALGGAMQPLMQIPQQLGQAAQGLMQTGMGAMQQMGGSLAAEPIDQTVLDAAGLAPYGGDLGEGAGGGGGGSAGGGGGATAPSAMLGPPATPTGGTVPTAGRAAALPVAPAAAPQTAAPMLGGGGMGMIPPGMMHGLSGQGKEGKDAKPDTKRVVPPTVRNGAPIQGRLTVPPTPPPVTKGEKGDDAMTPITTRRVIVPGPKSDKPDNTGA